MALLTINIDDAVLARHLALIGDGTLEQHLNAYLAQVADDAEEAEPEPKASIPGGLIPWKKAVEIAIERMQEQQSKDERFTLQELFTLEEWSRVQSPKWVGRRFGERVEAAKLAKRVSTTPTNKAIYKRTA